MSAHIRSDLFESLTSKRSYCLFFIWLIIIIVFFQVVSADYVNFDEYSEILANPRVKTPFTLESLKTIFVTFESNQYTPLSMASYWLEYNLFGFNSAVSHFVNFLLHMFAASFVFLFFDTLLKKRMMAICITLFWALHPFQVESVAWVLERRNLFYGTFIFASLWFYLLYADSERKLYLFLSTLCFILSGLSKTLAFMVPFFWLIIDWLRQRKISFSLLLEKIPGFCAAGFLLYMLFAGAWRWMPQNSGSSLEWNRCFYGLYFYFSKTIFPYGLVPLYEENAGTAGLFDYAFIKFAVVAIFVGFAIYIINNRRLAFAGLLFFFCNIFPVAGLIRVGHEIYAATHFMYVALFGLSLFWAVIFDEIEQRISWLRIKARYVFLIFIIIFCAVSFQHTAVWFDTITLFEYILKVDPHTILGRNQLALGYYELDRIDEAEKLFAELVEIAPKKIHGYNGMAAVSHKKGNIEEAIEWLSRGLRICSADPSLLRNRAFMLLETGRFRDAEQDCNHAISLEKTNTKAYAYRALVLGVLGRYQRAIEDQKTVLEHLPHSFSTQVKLLRMHLESAGYVQALFKTTELLQILKSEHFDLLTLDFLLKYDYKFILIPYLRYLYSIFLEESLMAESKTS